MKRKGVQPETLRVSFCFLKLTHEKNETTVTLDRRMKSSMSVASDGAKKGVESHIIGVKVPLKLKTSETMDSACEEEGQIRFYPARKEGEAHLAL